MGERAPLGEEGRRWSWCAGTREGAANAKLDFNGFFVVAGAGWVDVRLSYDVGVWLVVVAVNKRRVLSFVVMGFWWCFEMSLPKSGNQI